mgnify:CR=1 FL=1
MFLVGLFIMAPLFVLLFEVCYLGYIAVRALNRFGIVLVMLFCAPLGYILIRLIAALWILFD